MFVDIFLKLYYVQTGRKAAEQQLGKTYIVPKTFGEPFICR